MIRILIAANHMLMRTGIRSLEPIDTRKLPGMRKNERTP